MNRTKTIAVGAICALAATGTTATAASLITSAKIADGTILNRDIHRGTIAESRLDNHVVAKLNRLAAASPRGATGAAGATGATGATGAAGQDGATGAAAGQASESTLNPAVAVKASGNAGWSYTGSPAAKLTGGELRLAGGFDSSTAAGGIGMSHAYAQAPLSTVSALTYSARVDKRPAASVDAPVIHVTLTGARRATGTSTFTNLVFEPANNGGIDVGETKTFDALGGQWWSTNDLVGHPRQATASLAAFVNDNPDAKVIGISIDNGGSSGNTIPVADLSMGADNLVVGFGAGFDRYDFGG